MAKKTKSSKTAKKRTIAKKRRRASAAQYSIWRYWAPVALVTQNEQPLPASAIPRALSLTGFSDLKSLNADINKHQRGKIPASLQKRLSRLLEVQVAADAVDRPIGIKIGRKTYKLPYPFRARSDARGQLIIAAMSLQEKQSSDNLELSARIQVAVPKMLSARSVADEPFCRLMAGEMDVGDLDDGKRKIISLWLSRQGMKTGDIEKFVDDRDDALSRFRDQFMDRIEELVSVVGADGLLDDKEEVAFLSGDEEKGFIKE